MPRSLADDLVDDVAATFLELDHFGESATYTPRGGAARSIRVVVEEDNRRRDDGRQQRTVDRKLRVHAGRSATDGIDAPRLYDTLVLDSEPATTWSLADVVSATPGLITLEFTARTLDASGQIPAAL